MKKILFIIFTLLISIVTIRTIAIAQAIKIPERAMMKHISGMNIGETRWTVPWAICVDADRTGWLMPDSPVELLGPGGTVQLKITRTKNGFVAELYDYRDWSFEVSARPCPHNFPVIEFSGVNYINN